MSAPPLSTSTTTAGTPWGIELHVGGCSNCGAAFLVEGDPDDVTCPACFSACLAPQPVRMRPEPPELVLPYSFSRAQVAAALRNWMQGIWFRPPDLDSAVLLSRLSAVYLPMWLVDGQVGGTWQAQAGFNYEVASSQEVYRGDRWDRRQVTETRIRWEPRVGQIEKCYQNRAVPALQDHDRIMAWLGSFDAQLAAPYAPGLLSGSVARVPDLAPEAAAPLARVELAHAAQSDVQIASAAQHLDQFTLQADCAALNWTQLLLPVYTTGYRDDDGNWIPVYVNGRMGHVGGARRASVRSAWRWTLLLAAVAVALFLAAALFWALSSNRDPSPIGTWLLIAGILLGIASPAPIAWAWQFNRSQG